MSFPFILSLFIAMAVVVVVSLVANKGINARKQLVESEPKEAATNLTNN